MTRLYTAPRGQLALFPGVKPESESHANRGRDFERALDEMHDLYRATGVADVRKNYVKSTVVGNGKWARVDGPAIVDYTGTVAPCGRYVAFDAKDCEGTVISLDRLKEHQAAYLGGVAALGGAAFILVRFEGRRVWRVPIRAWSDADLAHRYGANCEESVNGFRITGKASIRQDEMPAAWAVDGYDWIEGVER